MVLSNCILQSTPKNDAILRKHLDVRQDGPAPRGEPLPEGGARRVAHGEAQGDAVDDVAALEADVREAGAAEGVGGDGRGVEHVVRAPAVEDGRLALAEAQVAHLDVGVELVALDEVSGRKGRGVVRLGCWCSFWRVVVRS